MQLWCGPPCVGSAVRIVSIARSERGGDDAAAATTAAAAAVATKAVREVGRARARAAETGEFFSGASPRDFGGMLTAAAG